MGFSQNRVHEILYSEGEAETQRVDQREAIAVLRGTCQAMSVAMSA
jgi:hypothetical protein